MKNSRRKLLLFGLVVAVSSLPGCAPSTRLKTIPGDLPGWGLVWHDEFQGDTLDHLKWRVEDAALVKNNELQYYSPDEVYLRNGVLVLRSGKRSVGGRAYTSGLVDTRGKFAQQYGRFEVRAKLPPGQGMWPAHWLLPEDGRWPPEIDIMESKGHEPNIVYMTNHWGVWPNNKHEGDTYTGPDFAKDFHVFAVEWEPDEIRWFVDEKQGFSTTANIPAGRFYIILNTAVGGMFPGPPDKTTVFPQYHQIDYVRIYVRDIEGTFILTTSADHGKVVLTPRDQQNRYQEGSVVTISAKPRIGYQFSHWSGDLSGNHNPVTLTMNRHTTLSAHFSVDLYGPKLLSQAKTATASSVEPPCENLSFVASHAVDGKRGTRWSSQFNDPQWIAVDLGDTYTLEAVRLVWEAAYGKEYAIQVSEDARTWKTVYVSEIGTGGIEEVTLPTGIIGRHVRMYGTARATSYGYSLYEFEVYGRGN